MIARIAVALASVALAGCAEGLRFERDERLRFTSPPDRSTAAGPVVVRWAMRGTPSDPSGADGRRRGGPLYALFVDRHPMRPGQELASLPDVERICRGRRSCQDAQGLAAAGIHLTTVPEVALPALPPRRGEPLGDLRRHELTVVLLDRRGRRAGESAWTLTLYTREDGR